MRRLLLPVLMLAGCATAGGSAERAGDHLFVWAGAGAEGESDFLAVVDVGQTSPTYGRILAAAPVGARGGAHHTEHQMPAGGFLAANAFGSGRTFLFDLRRPLQPSVVGSFGEAGEYMHPHSFARLPNGNLLATYQMRGHGNATPGGLAEIDGAGRVIRVSDASDPGSAEPFIRPYSLAVVPALDRVVTTSSDMHATAVSRAVQVWRLSDLRLIRTIVLPPGPRGGENEDPAEPRVLADGRTVMVSTFTCGLFLLRDIQTDQPSAQFVHSFSQSDKCALPVVAGRYWVQTDASYPALISLDVSDPARPREVGRLTLQPRQFLHWIALAPDGERIVISGGNGDMRHHVLMARIDRSNGRLSLDHTFRTPGAAEPGISFDRNDWPHGRFGSAVPHGAVFGN
jgi:hypothetical protein